MNTNHFRNLKNIKNIGYEMGFKPLEIIRIATNYSFAKILANLRTSNSKYKFCIAKVAFAEKLFSEKFSNLMLFSSAERVALDSESGF